MWAACDQAPVNACIPRLGLKKTLSLPNFSSLLNEASTLAFRALSLTAYITQA